jgi:DNA-binding FadR family transcriptional regulator/DNA-binding LacI/PurR family transcriptional regulator
MSGQSSGSSDFIESLASRIAEEFKESRDSHAPAQSTLARRYEVSRTSIQKAAKVLADRGIVTLRRGGRMVIVANRKRRDSHSKSSAPKRAANRLSEEITSGKYRSQTALPKISYLSDSLDTSPVSVCRALRRLEQDDLVHKSGKQWIVGPPKRGFARDAHSVILILEEKPSSWPQMDNGRTSSFVREFTRESQRHNTILKTIIASEDNPYEGWYPSGRKAVEQAFDEYGPRLRGVLLAGSHREIRNLDEWIAYLAPVTPSVVWFDRYDEPAPLGRSSRIPKNFTHCRFREYPALQLGLEYLRERNHQRVVFLDTAGEEWSINRGDEIEKLAGRKGMTVQRVDPEHSFSPEQAEAFFRELDKKVRGAQAPEPDCTLGHVRAVATCLSLNPTAVLAANDNAAYRLYAVSLNRGIRIPDYFSLLSFDNRNMLFPFDSIDFGFDNLGYAAFHSILGDIPVKHSRGRVIDSRPWVVPRATVRSV